MRHTVFIFMSVCCALAASCSQTSQRHYETEVATAEKTSLHAVHDERLRQVMRRLQTLTADRLPQEMDVRMINRTEARELADIAGSLASSSDEIPATLTSAELGDNDRAGFERLAMQLRADADQVRSYAERGDMDGVKMAVHNMTRTCNACHDAYRSSPVSVPSPHGR